MKKLILCYAFVLITFLSSAQSFYSLNEMPSLTEQTAGTKLRVLIPATRFTEGGYSVTGTGTYDIYSDLRYAAVHSGAVRPELGGIVIVKIKQGITKYTGSLQNGVQSKDAEGSENDLCFTVHRDSSFNYLPENVLFVDWTTPSNIFLKEYQGKVLLFYPPDGKPWGFVNGTDIYTWDSHIGTAAVHAGKLTFEKGGLVSVEFYPKGKQKGPFKGSTRNGVKTGDWNIPASFETFHFLQTAVPKTGNQTNASNTLQSAGVTNDFVFVKLKSEIYNAAGFHVNGDHVSILYDTSTGALQKIYYQHAGSTDGVFITCDEEQRPYLIETKEAVYRFYNFKNHTASLIKTVVGQAPQVIDHVTYDWEPPEAVPPGKQHGPSAMPYNDIQFEITAAGIIKTTGYALKIATCGLAAAASAGAAIIPCTSVFVSAMADFLPDDNQAKKDFQMLEKIIGTFEGFTPQGFPKKRIMELLELSQTIAEKDLKVYETCKTIKGWLDARNSVINYIDPGVYSKPASGNVLKPQSNTAATAHTFSYDKKDFVSIFSLTGDDLKEETMQAALNELGNNNYGLLNMTGIFTNIGKKVSYLLIKSPLDDQKSWELIQQKQKEGYRLVFCLLYSVLMKIEGADNPVIHELKKQTFSENVTVKQTEQALNVYLKEGYEFIGAGVQYKNMNLMLLKQPGVSAEYEMRFIGVDGFADKETIAALASQGFHACEYYLYIHSNDPGFKGTAIPFVKNKSNQGFESRELVHTGTAGTNYKGREFKQALTEVVNTCNLQVHEGYYLNFFIVEKNKIQMFFYK